MYRSRCTSPQLSLISPCIGISKVCQRSFFTPTEALILRLSQVKVLGTFLNRQYSGCANDTVTERHCSIGESEEQFLIFLLIIVKLTLSVEMVASVRRECLSINMSQPKCGRETQERKPTTPFHSSSCWNSAKITHRVRIVPPNKRVTIQLVFFRTSNFTSSSCATCNISSRRLAEPPPLDAKQAS